MIRARLDFKYHQIYISSCAKFSSKSYSGREAKVMQKLLGSRQSGSKRRWYPSQNQPQLTSAISISRTGTQNKSSGRRVTVLNKLFMKNITDLMATGEISPEIVGKGIEVSRVKVTSDFQEVKVFWIAKGLISDKTIEDLLNACSGRIRHELSQLRLMGEVPKITFVKDKSYIWLTEIDTILKNCCFEENVANDDFNQLKNDLNLESLQVCQNDGQESFPTVNGDVLGLKYEDLMSKISLKLKKSCDAWGKHEGDLKNYINDSTENKHSSCSDDILSRKPFTEMRLDSDTDFEQFLMKRKFKKNLTYDKITNHFTEYDQGNDFDEENHIKRNLKDLDDYLDEYDENTYK